MPLLLAILGVAIFIAAVRNSQSDLSTLVVADAPAFFPWAGAILAIGAIGFIEPARGISRGLLALIVLVIFLADQGGFFVKFSEAMQHPPQASTPAKALATDPGPIPLKVDTGAAGAGGVGGILGKVAGDAAGKLASGGIEDLLSFAPLLL